MRHDELFYLLALQKVDGVGDVVAKKLLAHCGTAEAVFSAKSAHIRSIDGIGSVLMKNLRDKNPFILAEDEYRYIRDHNIHVISYTDDAYPAKLQHCPDGPTLLFSTGNIDLKARKVISIVGTRQVTSYGAEFCRTLIADLAPLNPVIVSGFAYGVDIIAHQAALEHNLQTVAVLAHGLNQIYPKSHKKFIAPIDKNGGFLTEFWSSSNPERENFVKRNRIVAGMSEATIVIESADKGGSLITANIANDYNRDVFAVPGRTSDKYSQGCNNLIKSQKAHLLTQAADLVYILNWQLENKNKAVQKKLFVSLNADEQVIYDYLHANGKQLLDVIALECHLPVFRLSSLLLNMELNGVIRPLPGKLFEAV